MIKYRDALEDEAYEIAKLVTKVSVSIYHKTFPDYKEYFDKTEEDILALTEIIKKRIRESSSYIVVTSNNKIVGSIHYDVVSNGRFKGFGYIQDFFILSQYQGKGYGTELLKRAALRLLDMGITKLYVDPIKGTKSVFFYQKLGGVVVSTSNFVMKKIVVKAYDVIFNDLNILKKS